MAENSVSNINKIAEVDKRKSLGLAASLLLTAHQLTGEIVNCNGLENSVTLAVAIETLIEKAGSLVDECLGSMQAGQICGDAKAWRDLTA